MGEPVAFTMELISAECAELFGNSLCLQAYEFQVAARDLPRDRVRELIHQDHLRAKRSHHAGALLGVPPGHHRNERITLYAANNGQARSHVP